MISNILTNPIVIVIASVLAVILLMLVEQTNPRLGEILGMGMVFPIVVFGILTIIEVVLYLISLFLPPKAKKGLKPLYRTLNIEPSTMIYDGRLEVGFNQTQNP